ncbi:hypothetical protein BDK51DRAFT_48341 [Blyttiomyces helicus]|uniref:Uncharacterized protein n=1 Tax=Blyttiomyces helicus TaxID=388810 RepID=A0A4P9VXA2_9FUNG|nr:hypothetical protein BDK51DRAFT_48341 [Blyttiomyces helicus]|eukprot:RKO84351.1 hypothetical protein BDK51DRAFT_48341 [Blyttiomyces helicus]
MSTCYNPQAFARNRKLIAVRNSLEQLLGYLVRDKVRFGILTSYERTYFVRREVGNTWSVSRPILGSALTTETTVSFRRAIAYAWSLAVMGKLPLHGFNRAMLFPSPSGSSGLSPPSCGDGGRPDAEGDVSRSSRTSTSAGYRGQQEAHGSVEGGSMEAQAAEKAEAEGEEDYAYPTFSITGARASEGAPPRAISAGPSEAPPEGLVDAEILAYSLLEEIQGLAIPRFIEGGSWLGAGVVAVEEIGPGRVEAAEGWDHLTPNDQELARASLQVLYSKGFIHGDLRLDNLLFADSDGARRAVWIDLARSRRASAAEIMEEMEELKGI